MTMRLDEEQQDTFNPVNVSRERTELGKPISLADSMDNLFPVVEGEDKEGEVVVPEEPQVQAEAVVPEEPVTSQLDSMFPVVEEEEEIPVTAELKVQESIVEEPIDSQLDSIFPVAEGTPSPIVETAPVDTRSALEIAMEEEKALGGGTSEDEYAAYATEMLPEGVEAGSYSPDDIAGNEALYGVVKDYMTDKIGVRAVKTYSKEELVDTFLQSRRNVAMSGNIWSVGSEVDYLVKISDDETKMRNAAAAYVLYESMAGITSDDYSWGELGQSSWDVIQGIATDPMTYLSLGFGKVAGAGFTKLGSDILNKQVMSHAMKGLAKGMSKEAVKGQSKNIALKAGLETAEQQAKSIAKFTAQNVNKTGLEKLASREGVREVIATVAFDAAAGSLSEYLYQTTLVDSGVQEDINKYSVGMAAVATLVIGGAVGARVATRGFSKTALPNQDVVAGSPKVAIKRLQTSIDAHLQDVKKNKPKRRVVKTSFEGKKSRAENTKLSTEFDTFFDEFLLGVSETLPDGSVRTLRKGLAHVMQEEGFYRRTGGKGDDTAANHFANFIRANFTQADIIRLIKSGEDQIGKRMRGFTDSSKNPLGTYKTGPMKKQPKYPTPSQFADAFAARISKQAEGMGVVSKAASLISADVPTFQVEAMLKGAADPKLLKSKGEQTLGSKAWSYLSDTTVAVQGRYVRSLVSSLSTSALNVLGYGVVTAMGTTTDLVRAFSLLGVGAGQQLLGEAASKTGLKNIRTGSDLIEANINRIQRLFDSDMTAEAFNSISLKSTGAIARMLRVQGGGVDMGKSVDDIVDTTWLGRKHDKLIEWGQFGTLVKTQDIMTKSQEFVFQMDKALRAEYGMSWNKFYGPKHTEATRKMNTARYAEIEEEVVATVMRNTFSESYANTSTIAKMIEESRRYPFVGMYLPFGKFFNNTVAFTARNMPIGNVAIKYMGRDKFEDMPWSEVWSRNVVSGGLLYSYAEMGKERREEGLGAYEFRDKETGEIITHEYDYPISLYAGGGMVLSYILDGELPPMELLGQLGTDFGISGLTRGLTTTADDVTEMFKYLLAGEISIGLKDLGAVASGTISQYAAGVTRSLDNVDTLIGTIYGADRRPTNIKDGNKFWGKTLTNLDNTVQLLTGATQGDPKFSAIEGPLTDTTGRQTGLRTVQMTNSMRIMNILSYEYWTEGPSSKANNLAAGASNSFKKVFFRRTEDLATQLMNSDQFMSYSLEDKRKLWNEKMSDIKELTLLELTSSFEGRQNTAAAMIKLVDKYPKVDLHNTMRALNMSTDIGDLTLNEVLILTKQLEIDKALSK